MEFYQQNQVILVTGGTGFIGKVLVEKILRSLPQVKKIYLLARAVDKAQLQKRVDKEIFGARLFEPLKAQFKTPQDFKSQIMSKVVPVRGDLMQDHIGLSEEDKAMVQADTTVVISVAADIGYLGSLRDSVETNCYGPLRILKLAEGMPRLASIVHVSTSFVNAHLGPHVKELLYPYPLGDADQLIEEWQRMSDDELSAYERDVALKTFVNTYVASKSLAEHLIQSWSRSMNLPVVIVRPAVVIGAHSEPMPGWVEGLGGINGTTILMATGRIQEWIGFEHLVTDLVPVDFVCKTILQAAPEARRGQASVPIFQSGSSSHSPVTHHQGMSTLVQYWPRARESALKRGLKTRIADDIRPCYYSPSDYELQFQHRFSRELKLIQDEGEGYEKIGRKLAFNYRTVKMFGTFGLRQWVWDATESIKLDDRSPNALQIGLRDRIDWDLYFHNYYLGLHEFILREKVDRTMEVVRTPSWKSYQKHFHQNIDNRAQKEAEKELEMLALL